jgi:hypothetical protein
MRNILYTVTTYHLTNANHGDQIKIGARDKYWFTDHDGDGDAEFYHAVYTSGRTITQYLRYELNVIALANDGNSQDVTLKTGDIFLGVSSNAGTSPYLYFLRPVYQRG